jgi:hypothetical protein
LKKGYGELSEITNVQEISAFERASFKGKGLQPDMEGIHTGTSL